MKNFKFLVLMFTMFCFLGSEAQDDGGIGGYFSQFKPARKWSGGIQLGPSSYNGDADDFKAGFFFGGHVKYSISQSFGLKLSGDLGSLKGGREGHNFSRNSQGDQFLNTGNQNPSSDSYGFTNKFKDLNVVAEYTLGNISFLRPLRKLQMFTFFGVGAIWSDAKGNYGDAVDAQNIYKEFGSSFVTPLDANGDALTDAAATANPSLIADAESVYEGRNFAIPFGIGVKRNINDRFDLGLSWRSHWTRSDNLDAFSYPIWRNRLFDFYSLLGVQASFKFGSKDNLKEHYDWLNPVETIYSDMDTMKEITTQLKTLVEDSDGDGIGDFYDTEPNTDKEAKVYGDGSSVDSDRDGVPDHKDKELFSVVTDVDADGRAKDADGDGVPDVLDEEPNTPADALVNVKGAAIDMGGACCNCENVSLPTVMFDNNSSKISASSYGVLYAIAEKMKSCPELSITATGYTRSKSGEQLAYKRVNSILDHLESNYGIERSRVNTEYSNGSGIEYSTRRIDLGHAK